MSTASQVQKARAFLALHHAPKLLVLPNIWDPLGARLLASLGYPAVATASAAVAYSLGYDDGQKISFAAMLETISRIDDAIDIPLTADIERGYAESPAQLADHIRQVIAAGAVGINLEDSRYEGGPLVPISAQCERLAAARQAAEDMDIHLVINARIDVFIAAFPGSPEDKLRETIERGRAYRAAGACCIYPILLSDPVMLAQLKSEVAAPINVFAAAGTPSMRDLEAMGISRLSLGPGLLKASLTAMKKIAATLQHYGSYDDFTQGVISNEEIAAIISHKKMSGD